MVNTAYKQNICLLIIIMVIVLVVSYIADNEIASNQEMDVSNREIASNQEMDVSNREITADSYLLFETVDKEEYLQFLNELDSSDTYELSFVSVEVSYYGSHPFNYSIVYKKSKKEKDPTRYEYYLFESDFYPRFLEFDFEKRKEDDFWFFLDNLSNDSEIVDISIGIHCAKNHAMFPVEPEKMFFITYRKPV